MTILETKKYQKSINYLKDMKLELAEKKWKERVEDGEQEEGIEEMGLEEESGKNLQWIPEAMIKLLNMMGKTKCKKCNQSRLTLKHMEAMHGFRCKDLAIEKDLDGLMKIKGKKLKELSKASKEVWERMDNRYNEMYEVMSS